MTLFLSVMLLVSPGALCKARGLHCVDHVMLASVHIHFKHFFLLIPTLSLFLKLLQYDPSHIVFGTKEGTTTQLRAHRAVCPRAKWIGFDGEEVDVGKVGAAEGSGLLPPRLSHMKLQNTDLTHQCKTYLCLHLTGKKTLKQQEQQSLQTNPI